MNDFSTLPTFNPNGTAQAIMGVVFYAIMLLVTFVGFSTIYVLVKHSATKALSVFLSVMFLIFFFALSAQGIHQLSLIH